MSDNTRPASSVSAPSAPLSPAAQWLALASICIATFLIPQSMSAVNMALPAIAADLNADAVLVSWLPTANIWGSIILMLPAGRIADMVGRKRVYLIGVLFFSLSSLIPLVIQSVEWLLFVRVLQGLASAMVFATGMALVSTIFEPEKRGMALGLGSTSVYLGLTCGPLIGGWLTEHLGWRAVFWGPVPFALIAVVLVVIYVREQRPQGSAQRLDWLGSALFAAWTTAFFFGLSGLPEVEYLLVTLAGLALLYLFVRQQAVARNPLIRLRALADNKIFSRSIIASLFMYGAHYPVLFLLSLYLQYIQGMTPAEAGQLILVQALIMAVIAPLAGRLSDRYEPRFLATAGCLTFGAGFLVLMALDTDSSTQHVFFGLVLLGAGFGFFSSPNNNAALTSVPAERLSIASALLNLARTLGNMFSMAVVVFLVNLMMGNAEIVPENYPQLLQVIRVALGLAFLYTLAAALASFRRGQLRS